MTDDKTSIFPQFCHNMYIKNSKSGDNCTEKLATTNWTKVRKQTSDVKVEPGYFQFY